MIRFRMLLVCGVIVSTSAMLNAATLEVPNFSFESQSAPDAPPFVNIFVDAWQKAPEPAYYGPAIGTPFGIPWAGTAGVFRDINPYSNRLGNQAGYILGFPGVSLFQDYNSSPTHEFDHTFVVGLSYRLTVGVFGKGTLAPGSTLELSLYYLDADNNPVTVGATTATYSEAAFPASAPLSLVDYSVTVPTVAATDPWAGRHLGIKIESTTPLGLATGGNWDLDNVRLEVIPEPAPLVLLFLGAALLGFVCRRPRPPGQATS